MTIYTVIVDEDDAGNIILPLPPDCGWIEGDTIVYDLGTENQITIRNLSLHERQNGTS